MNMFAQVVLLGWIPVVLSLFVVLKPRTAVLCALIGGWLFLPMFGYDLTGLPTYDKASATAFGLLIGIAIFDAQRLVKFRPHLIDVPALAWCLCPFLSSMTNRLGTYDGASESLNHILIWGTPYFVGRLYFWDRAGLTALAKGIVIGGLLYLPLCLYEIRLSPQLHRTLYGMHQHSFSQTMRFGGYRPDVFMQHGLMVALWMASATLVGSWMMLARQPRSLWKVPMVVIVVALLVTTVLCKSVGALALLMIGLGVVLAIKYLRMPGVLLVAALLVPLYLTLRIPLDWDGSVLVEAAKMVDAERAESLEFRLSNEEMLKQHHMRRPIFGWGGWDRHRVEETDTATDSMWIIAFGKRGAFGLISLFLFMLTPIVVLVWNAKRKRIALTLSHPAVPLAAVALMFTLDCLVNAMINPVYIVAAGAIGGAAITVETRRRRMVVVRKGQHDTEVVAHAPVKVT